MDRTEGQDVTSHLVTIDNVDMRYGGPGGTLAVSGLTLHVEKGEFTAVVGPSGCGKSTLMKLVTGLYIPQVGAITVAGKEVTEPVSIVGCASLMTRTTSRPARPPRPMTRARPAPQFGRVR